MGTAPKTLGSFKEIKSAVAEVNTYTSGDSSVLSRSVQAKKGQVWVITVFTTGSATITTPNSMTLFNHVQGSMGVWSRNLYSRIVKMTADGTLSVYCVASEYDYGYNYTSIVRLE